MIYRALFALVLTRIDAERAHRIGGRVLHLIAGIPPLLALTRAVFGRTDPRLRVHALGLDLASPLGVAAGLDKEATAFAGLGALGFGFVEIGTITALPQEGNPKPRVFRFPPHEAIVNRMGFPNPGAEAVVPKLRARKPGAIVGANIGKTKIAEDAAADYAASARALAPLSDYLVVNVSSPNTPGLRDMQAVEPLRGLFATIGAALEKDGVSIPVLVKIAPDLADEDVLAIADLALELGLDGIIATNTTIDPAKLKAAGAEGVTGGLSGPPVASRALEVLRLLRGRVGDRLLLVSVGGVSTADDVWERLAAGATLVQAYTAFVYGGPGWARRVNRELAARLAREGIGSVADLVGSEAR
ncbi:MAG: quinone-dependent dihydroorotate dehydrogenase [Solirubrobacteraceae bacterium]|nr:quinone-dependent dihydroorotate dehydrogenase [Solirubrobacteraceae bacterium]